MIRHISFYTTIFDIHFIQEDEVPMPDNVKNIEIGGRQLHYVDQGEAKAATYYLYSWRT